jgi:F-type H+-transporting ATPase subunit a
VQLWKLPNIVLAPEQIFNLFGFSVTNTLFCTVLTIIFLAVLFFFGTRRRDLVPSGLQNFLELIVEFLLNLVEGVSGKVKGRRFFPFVATFFIFIVVANLIDVLPGVDTVGTIDPAKPLVNQPVLGFLLFGDDSNKIIPWLRPPTTDLNLTLAMALVSVVVTQIFGFLILGTGSHLTRYFNFKALFTHGPLGIAEFFVGLLEVVSEIGRLISFSFRLFGNIFAGSILLAVFAFLVPVFLTIIFIPFELFIAVIQAFVFAFLTLLFLEVGTTSHSHSDEEGVHEAVHEYEENKTREAVAAHS